MEFTLKHEPDGDYPFQLIPARPVAGYTDRRFLTESAARKWARINHHTINDPAARPGDRVTRIDNLTIVLVEHDNLTVDVTVLQRGELYSRRTNQTIANAAREFGAVWFEEAEFQAVEAEREQERDAARKRNIAAALDRVPGIGEGLVRPYNQDRGN